MKILGYGTVYPYTLWDFVSAKSGFHFWFSGFHFWALDAFPAYAAERWSAVACASIFYLGGLWREVFAAWPGVAQLGLSIGGGGVYGGVTNSSVINRCFMIA